MSKEIIKNFFTSVLKKDLKKVTAYIDPNFRFLHRNIEELINGMNGKMIISYDQHSETIETNKFEDFYLTFLGETLIDENIYIINEDKILGTKNRFDCFGKLRYINDKPERIIVLRLPKNEIPIGLFVNNQELNLKKGPNFENDRFYLIEYNKINDDYKTISENVSIITKKGIFNKKIILRGEDFPRHSFIKPIINENNLKFNSIENLYSFEVTLENGMKFYEFNPKQKTFIFESKIKILWLSTNGTAFNYIYQIE